MKDYFLIHNKFGEQIALLSDAQAGVLFRALIGYQLGQELPEMDGMTNIVFTVIRQQIDIDNQKREEICRINTQNGKKGGRPSKSLLNKGNKPKKPNGFSGFCEKPNGFQNNRTVFERENTPNKEERSKEENTTPIREINESNSDLILFPPFIPPLGEGESGKGSAKERFLELYPTIKANLRYFKGNDEHIDYDVLIERFSKSTVLRKKYSFTWIAANYDAIKIGFFDDTQSTKDERTEAADARADRERWYSARRAKAEAEAERKQKEVRKRYRRYCELETAYKAVELEIAKREVALESKNADDYEAQRLEDAKEARDRIVRNMANYVENCGYTMSDLLPQWHCPKCQDTGWQIDGKACDCFNA